MKDEVLDTLEHITERYWDMVEEYNNYINPVIKRGRRPQRLPATKPDTQAYLAECLKIIEFAGYKKNSADWKTCMRYINRKLDL